MTQLILDIPNRSDLDALIPLLNRLQISYKSTEISDEPLTFHPKNREEAMKIIAKGCDMSSFGDALEYQIETRKVGDALIAATAIVHREPLVTRNINDFTGILGLTVINPI